VTCMSSPTYMRSIDDTIDRDYVGTPLSTQEVDRAITAGSSPGWTIDADSSKRSEVRVGGVLCDEVRTNQARSPLRNQRFGKS
jgi:hypothetical protein